MQDKGDQGRIVAGHIVRAWFWCSPIFGFTQAAETLTVQQTPHLRCRVERGGGTGEKTEQIVQIFFWVHGVEGQKK